MKIYTLNEEGRAQVRSFIERAAKQNLIDCLDTVNGGFRDGTGLDSWCGQVEASLDNRTSEEPEGHLEIRGFDTRSGNPETCTFGPECFDSEEVPE